MSDRWQALRSIASRLNQLTEDPSARVSYELMSDALIWSDELPPWEAMEAGETHCLRAVWRFRSSLIMGEPEERFRPNWEKALELFPNWPGFLPKRQQVIWRDTFVEQSAKLNADMEDLERRFETQKRQEANGQIKNPRIALSREDGR